MNRKLVPDGFQLPELLENERVRLRMLTDLPPKNWFKCYVRYNEKIMHLPYTD